MAKQDVPLVYWDAKVFIDYLSLADPADGSSPIVSMIYAASERPQRAKIITSVISIAEVAYSTEEKNTGQLNDDARRIIDSLWSITSPIEVVEAYPELCRDARDLARTLKGKGRAGLRGADAIHVATAMSFPGVSEFHTSNGRIKKLNDQIGDLVSFEICESRDASIMLETDAPQHEEGAVLPLFDENTKIESDDKSKEE